MQTVRTIGLDIAKSVFRVHGVDADGQVVIRRQLRRRVWHGSEPFLKAPAHASSNTQSLALCEQAASGK